MTVNRYKNLIVYYEDMIDSYALGLEPTLSNSQKPWYWLNTSAVCGFRIKRYK